MSISMYDPELWDGKVPANVLGGRSRAQTAKRLQGKFLPKDEFLASLISPDPNHGRAGGRARARTGRKNSKGQFIKAS